jgi:hypothetical protein
MGTAASIDPNSKYEDIEDLGVYEEKRIDSENDSNKILISALYGENTEESKLNLGETAQKTIQTEEKTSRSIDNMDQIKSVYNNSRLNDDYEKRSSVSDRLEYQESDSSYSSPSFNLKKKQIFSPTCEESVSPSEEDKLEDLDSNPMEILFQFIPYYGQGNLGTDSTVRATLKNLLVDDIDFRDDNGNTLLLLACQYRCEDLVRIMLNKGADPNAFNSSGACCLHFACYKDSSSKSIAKALLQNGANPEVKESTYGCTPLHYCSSVGDLDFCKMLISYGGLVSTRDYYGYTCVDYAREAEHPLVARYLQVKIVYTTLWFLS